MAGGFVPFDGDERQAAVLLDEIKERFVSVIGAMKA